MNNPTPGQQIAADALRNALDKRERLFLLWYGGIRAGKTVGAVDCMVRHGLSRTGVTYIVGGYTVRAVFANVEPYFRQISKELGLKYKSVAGVNNPRFEVEGNTYRIYGGGKAGDDKAVQGLTAGGCMLDEYELLDRTFVKQCEARISLPGALRVYTANKANPYTWAVKEYYQRALSGEIDAVLIESGTDENQHLEVEFVKEKRKEFDTYFTDTFLNNAFGLPFQSLYQPEVVESLPDGSHDIDLVYRYGNQQCDLSVIRLDGEQPSFVITERGIGSAGTTLVNSNSPILGREIRLTSNVRGYSDLFNPIAVEMAKRMFDSGLVKVDAESAKLRENLALYHQPGVYPHCSIMAIERIAEYLQRIYQW